MNLIGLALGLLIVAVGIVGIFAPYRLFSISQYFITPAGLYTVAAIRVGVGLLLLKVSSGSRLPKTLRVFGFIATIAGLTTPLVGVDRARAILYWWLTQGPLVMRLWAVLAVVVGGVIVYALAGRRRAAAS